MYIVTFYSFRGGVGRTTALVNAGVELARRGRKVLLVDFDLESPDLTSFPNLGRPEPQPGMVEYVAAYREKGWTPDVTEYLYPLEPVASKKGRLWVMPAGRYGARSGQGDPEYWEALAEIDWQGLYDRQEGYLFFEDTRLQWEQLGVDYVLIDTHAGITPPLGIATRQLADAVVMVFNPHQGGKNGLDEVSYRIYEEAERNGSKPIEQLFVASGVVEADAEPRRDYENDLGIFDFVATVPFSHRLLSGKQVVVNLRANDRRAQVAPAAAWRRQDDRLTRAYRRLANALSAANFAQDPDGARVLLCEIHADPAKAIESREGAWWEERNYPGKLDAILKGFPKDPDIHAQIACCLFGAARYDRALAILDDAVILRPDAPELLWQRASYRRQLNYTRGAIEDLLHLLDARAPGPPAPRRTPAEIVALVEQWRNRPRAQRMYLRPRQLRFALPEEFDEEERRTALPDYADPLLKLQNLDPYVVSALRQLRQLDPEKYEEAKQKPCVTRLSPEAQQRLFADRLPGREDGDPPALIRAGKWTEVVTLLRPRLEESDVWRLEDAFHLFMAWWGLGNEDALRACGEKAKARFWQELEAPERPSVPEWQLMAVVFWKTGEVEYGPVLLDWIEEGVTWPEGEPIFSYWRYARVSWNQFAEDCQLLRQLFKGANVLPPFFGKEAAHR